MAFRILGETDGGDALGDPLVADACDWLAASSAPDGGVPWVLPSVVDGPRAPWWQPDDGTPGALVPTASIAGMLHAHGRTHRGSTAPRGSAASGSTPSPPAARTSTRTRRVPSSTSSTTFPIGTGPTTAFAGVREPILATVTFDPDAPGHVHLPIEYAPGPDGFGRRLFDDAVFERHLDLLVAAQADDGGWGVNWEAWAAVTVPEWRGHVTVERLKLLRAHGRWKA